MSKNTNTQVPQKPIRSARRAQNNKTKNIDRSLPLARGRRTKFTRTSRMRVFNDSNQSISLAGTDMFQLQSDQANGFHMTCNILANPLYWYGTRIAGIAKVYQKFRPKHLRFRYVPSCPATSSGSVTIGVIEAGVTLSPETAVTTLLNSGGKNINIYQTDAIDYYPKIREPCYVDGDISKPVVNPFTFCMYTLKNADVPPGIIYIDWEYDFLQGSGDQQLPIAVITSMTNQQKLALMSSNSDLFNENNLKFGWGTVLGFLKTVGVPILRKIGIVVCESVLAWLSDDSKSNAVMTNQVTIRDVSFLTIDPSDVYTSPDGKTRVKDANGSDYYLPDTARVAVYMAGDEIVNKKTSSPSPEPTIPTFNIFGLSNLLNRSAELDTEDVAGVTGYTCQLTATHKDTSTNVEQDVTLQTAFFVWENQDCLTPTGIACKVKDRPGYATGERYTIFVQIDNVTSEVIDIPIQIPGNDVLVATGTLNSKMNGTSLAKFFYDNATDKSAWEPIKHFF